MISLLAELSLSLLACPVSSVSTVCQVQLHSHHHLSCCAILFVQDLSCLGRAMPRTVLIDNAPHSYLFHPRNSVEILSFYEDQMDSELDRLLFFLNQYLVNAPDVRTRLDGPTKYLDILFEEALRDDAMLDHEPSVSVGPIFQA